MRKVRFNRYTPERFMNHIPDRVIPGTGECEKGYPNEGILLGWGVASVVFNTERCSVSNVALIELEDGTVEEVRSDRIKFDGEISDESDSALVDGMLDHVREVFSADRFKETSINEELAKNKRELNTSSGMTTNDTFYDKVKFGLSRGDFSGTLGLNITQDQFYELVEILSPHIKKMGWENYCRYVNESLSTRIIQIKGEL